jgi:hypothetical protein
MPRLGDEARKVAVRDGVQIHPEAVERHAMNRALLRIEALVAHAELAGLDPRHLAHHSTDEHRRAARTRFEVTLRRRGVMVGARQGRRKRAYPEDMGASEDAESRRPARPGGTRLHFDSSSKERSPDRASDASAVALRQRR